MKDTRGTANFWNLILYYFTHAFYDLIRFFFCFFDKKEMA